MNSYNDSPSYTPEVEIENILWACPDFTSFGTSLEFAMKKEWPSLSSDTAVHRSYLCNLLCAKKYDLIILQPEMAPKNQAIEVYLGYLNAFQKEPAPILIITTNHQINNSLLTEIPNVRVLEMLFRNSDFISEARKLVWEHQNDNA